MLSSTSTTSCRFEELPGSRSPEVQLATPGEGLTHSLVAAVVAAAAALMEHARSLTAVQQSHLGKEGNCRSPRSWRPLQECPSGEGEERRGRGQGRARRANINIRCSVGNYLGKICSEFLETKLDVLTANSKTWKRIMFERRVGYNTCIRYRGRSSRDELRRRRGIMMTKTATGATATFSRIIRTHLNSKTISTCYGAGGCRGGGRGGGGVRTRE